MGPLVEVPLLPYSLKLDKSQKQMVVPIWRHLQILWIGNGKDWGDIHPELFLVGTGNQKERDKDF